MKKTKKLAILLLSLIWICSLAACSDGAADDTTSGNNDESSETQTETKTGDSDTPSYGGSVSMYFREFSADYDPALSGRNNAALWYEKLWNVDLNSEISSDTESLPAKYMTGQIAKAWDYDAETQTLTVEIRDDIYFQEKDAEYNIYNARNLVASDVAWSYQRLLGIDGVEKVAAQQDWASDLYMLESVTVEGDYTVKFHLNQASEVALDDFIVVAVNIAGPEWDTLTNAQKTDWHYACGTGPFLLTDYVTDSYMKLSKNPNYYGTDTRPGYEGNTLPYLDSITFTLYTDTANAMAQFIAGNLDIMYSGSQILTNSQIDQLKDSMAEGSYQEIITATTSNGIALKQNNVPLQNLKVREAMQYAINSQEINDSYFGYTGDMIVPSLFSPGTEYTSIASWDDALKDSYYTYDPEKAKELLAEAGYGDGFEFTVLIFSDMDQDLYALARNYLSQVGITMNIDIVNTPVELQAASASESDTRCVPRGLGMPNIPTVYRNVHSGTGEDTVWALLSDNGTLDSLLEAINAATITADRVAAAQETDLYFARQHMVLQLGGCAQKNSFISSRIAGYQVIPTGGSWTDTFLAHVWVTD